MMVFKLWLLLISCHICVAERVHAPVRLRISSEMLSLIFHQGDRELLENFTNMTFFKTDES